MAAFGVVFGLVFYLFMNDVARFSFQAQMARQPMPMNVNEQVIRPLLSLFSTIALFLVPMITMRLFAEEKRTGTIELLLTSPVRDIEIILGKWLGGLAMYACVLFMTVLNIALLFRWGKPDWKPVLVVYLGLLLQGGAMLAIGTFISTTTKNQIVSVGLTFFACMGLWFIGWATAYETTPLAQVVGYLSLVSHLENFSKGVLDLHDTVFYLSMIFFGLFLTSRSMESLRWRA
jgi:ABC-2 type transport system permease protein